MQDEDAEDTTRDAFEDPPVAPEPPVPTDALLMPAELQARAAAVYADYRGPLASRFRWIPSTLFRKDLANDLRQDADALLTILADAGDWVPANDAKLSALFDLVSVQHSREKVLVFTQFADTARYLERELRARGLTSVAAVSGGTEDPTAVAFRFSPRSDEKQGGVPASLELRVLIATDLWSEGQNLQDAAIVVNFDLPWAVIRLVQQT